MQLQLQPSLVWKPLVTHNSHRRVLLQFIIKHEVMMYCSSVNRSHDLLMFLFLPLFFSPDFKNAFGFEVCVSIREHLEACCFIPAQGASYRITSGTTARLIWEVRHYVARAGQCLWRLSFHQKVQAMLSLLCAWFERPKLGIIMLFSFVLFSTPPDNLSIQEFQKNETVDVEVNDPRIIRRMSTVFWEGAYLGVFFISGCPAHQHRDFAICQFHPQRFCWPDHGDAQQRLYPLTVCLIHW